MCNHDAGNPDSIPTLDRPTLLFVLNTITERQRGAYTSFIADGEKLRRTMEGPNISDEESRHATNRFNELDQRKNGTIEALEELRQTFEDMI